MNKYHYILLLSIISFFITIPVEIFSVEYIITSTLDLPDEDLEDGVWYPYTLRSAIENMNKNGVTAKINCAEIEYQTIQLHSGLPAINVTVEFDGKGIVLEPAANSTANGGLAITSNNSILKNIKIQGFKGSGLFWRGSDGVITNCVFRYNEGPGMLMNYANRNKIGDDAPSYYSILFYGNKGTAGDGLQMLWCNDNIVYNCWFGLDSLGNPVGNERSGIKIIDESLRNKIQNNLISGNEWHGIQVSNKTSFTLIANNRIGTDYLGNSAIPNMMHGIYIEQSSADTIVNNLISGNEWAGIQIGLSTGAVVENNRIGTDRFVKEAIPNGSGISVANQYHIVRNNIVSGNKYTGISVAGTDMVIQSNIIGLDAEQKKSIPNGSGIYCSNYTDGILVIGDTIGYNSNIIASNLGDGISISASKIKNVIVARNIIGTNKDTSLVFPNKGAGVFIKYDCSDITVKENLIAANDYNGVRIERNVVIFLDTTRPKLYQKPFNIYIKKNRIGCPEKIATMGKHGGSGVSIFNADWIYVEDNYITGTDSCGIDIANDSTRYIRLKRNKIGPTNKEIKEMLISGDGIRVSGAKDVVIGDFFSPLDSNVIRYCKGYGLSVVDSAMLVNYYINSMLENERGGISLDDLNLYFTNGHFDDKFDEDTGSNGLQNTVNTSTAEAKNASIAISGKLEGVPNTVYKIFTYLSKKYDDSLKIKTQGTIYLDMFEVKTNDKGSVQIDTSWSSGVINQFSKDYPVVTMSVLEIEGSSPFSIIQNPQQYLDIEVKIDTSETYIDKDGIAKVVAKITNLGNEIATTVSVRDTLRNIEIKEMTISKGVIVLADSTIIATIPQLGKGESVFYSAYGKYIKEGEYVRSIKAIPSENDINPMNLE